MLKKREKKIKAGHCENCATEKASASDKDGKHSILFTVTLAGEMGGLREAAVHFLPSPYLSL